MLHGLEKRKRFHKLLILRVARPEARSDFAEFFFVRRIDRFRHALVTTDDGPEIILPIVMRKREPVFFNRLTHQPKREGIPEILKVLRPETVARSVNPVPRIRKDLR